MKHASIIIVTYGQWHLTEQCLRSLEAALGGRLGDTWEIVVVDNASPDETPERLVEWSDRVRVELLPENRNFAGGCNRGAELADSQVLVFLNSDTEVPAGALETLVEQLHEPGVAAAGCRLLFPNGAVQHTGVAFWRDERFGGTPMPLHVFFGEDQDLSATFGVYEADTVTGACLAVRADAFAEVGGFDEGYRNGFEDTDLCFKLRAAGHKVVLRGDVTITHHEGASRDTERNSEREMAVAHDLNSHNTGLFIGRWGAHLEQDDDLALTVWDGALRRHAPMRTADVAADLLLIGQPSGIGPGAEESRSLIAALSDSGVTTAAVDIHANVVARVTGSQFDALETALRAVPDPSAIRLYVASGRGFEYRDPSHQVAPTPGSLLRLASAEHVLELADIRQVLVPSSAVATGLRDRGLDESRITIVASPIEPRELGSGGEGVLLIFPTQDPELGRTIFSQLRELPRSVPIRVLPTVFSRDLERDIRSHLPGAELLPPCSDEERFATIAGTAEVVIAADPADFYERRALVAAGVGARPLVLRPDGQASEALGRSVVSGPEALRVSVTEALTDQSRRHEWQALSRAHCDPTHAARALSAAVALA